MSTRDQLSKHTSDYANEGTGTLTETAAVYNAQCKSVTSVNGLRFNLGPTEFRMVSAGATGFDGTYWRVLAGANVSAMASALSTAINFATSYAGKDMDYRISCGATAATAAGSASDITITAAVAGNNIALDRGSLTATKVTFTETTANRTGQTLGEGYLSYQTSAGSTIQVKDPAEYTRNIVTNPPKQN